MKLFVPITPPHETRASAPDKVYVPEVVQLRLIPVEPEGEQARPWKRLGEVRRLGGRTAGVCLLLLALYCVLVLVLRVAFGNWREAVPGTLVPVAVGALLAWLLRDQTGTVRSALTTAGVMVVLWAIVQIA